MVVVRPEMAAARLAVHLPTSDAGARTSRAREGLLPDKGSHAVLFTKDGDQGQKGNPNGSGGGNDDKPVVPADPHPAQSADVWMGVTGIGGGPDGDTPPEDNDYGGVPG